MLVWTVSYTFALCTWNMMHVLCLQKKYFLSSYIKKIWKKNLLFACKLWYFPPVYLSEAFEAAIKNNFKILWVWNLIFQDVLRAQCNHKDLLGKKRFLLSVTFTTLQGWKNFRLQVMIFINLQFLWYRYIYVACLSS